MSTCFTIYYNRLDFFTIYELTYFFFTFFNYMPISICNGIRFKINRICSFNRLNFLISKISSFIKSTFNFSSFFVNFIDRFSIFLINFPIGITNRFTIIWDDFLSSLFMNNLILYIIFYYTFCFKFCFFFCNIIWRTN